MIKDYALLFLWSLLIPCVQAQERSIVPKRIIFSAAERGNEPQQYSRNDTAYFSFLHPAFFLDTYNPDSEDSIANHCPDPVAIPLDDSRVLVYINSDWWLNGYSSTGEGDGCTCLTPKDVINRLRDIVYESRDKMMIIVSKHPMYNVGREAGSFTWKDHFFPLTTVEPNLYIPLPLIGSLVPVYHRIFSSTEEMQHPLYKQMISSITDVFSTHPNVVFVSALGGGQKMMRAKNKSYFQIVSGQRMGENRPVQDSSVLFESIEGGSVAAEFIDSSTVRWSFYTDASVQEKGKSFVYDWKAEKAVSEMEPLIPLSGDRVVARAHSAYDHGSVHTFLLGKNYRKEWSMPVNLPVLRISELQGGLRPIQLGGGLQSTSLRLRAKDGKQYVLRSVEKKPDLIVPHLFEGTIVRDVLDDVISSQHPYSALAVPPIASAMGVPHANPIIGVVAPDTAMRMYNALFQHKIALLEEREPLGKSDNYTKAFKTLQRDHDNSFDASNFLKARMLDLMVGDWDRHADQWRFYNEHGAISSASKYYKLVPRDRDMVFYVTEGLFPVLIKRLFVFPRIHGFDKHIEKGVLHDLYKSSFLNAHPANQWHYPVYKEVVKEVQRSLTDSVLETAVRKLPRENFNLRGEKLVTTLKMRRDGLERAMDRYYVFSNKIVDIRLSDKQEEVLIQDVADTDALRITVWKRHKKNLSQDTLMDKVYSKNVTKEVRLYLGEGDDLVRIRNEASSIKLRVIGGKGKKEYVVQASKHKVDVYDRKEAHYTDAHKRLKKHTDKKKDNTAFEPVNLYNTSIPQASLAYNPDDGFFLGLGFVHTQQQGFRKTPYASRQSVLLSHAFATNAFNIHYQGEWLQVLGNADILLSTAIKAPDNTQNFFGRGNTTIFDRDQSNNYYRSRFDLFDMMGGLRWRHENKSQVSVQLAYQYYHADEGENEGRFIALDRDAIGSYDSATVMKDKMHYGALFAYQMDRRDNAILPNWGSFFKLQVQGFAGLNHYSKSYMQIMPQFALYKAFGAGQRFVLGNRVGGGITLGHTTFYQSLFLGSEGNLLGYRRYRFAGQHSFYNNLELRWAKRDFGNYLLNGQVGLFAFYDIGRVWETDEHSKKWHQGFGPGLYIAPASLAVFRFSYGYTTEGWYPNFSMGWRF